MPLIFVLLKITLYYFLMALTQNLPLLLAVTTSYVLLGYWLFKKHRKIRLSLYVLLSILMFSSVIYYRYFNAILSLRTIGQANQLMDVTDSIWPLLDFSIFLLLIDLPFLFFYTPRQKAKLNKYYPLLALSIIVIIGFNPFGFSAFRGVGNTELLTFHVFDFLPPASGSESAFVTFNTLRERNIIKDTYFGAAKGKNIIVLQVEALQDMVVGATYNDQVITPNLNALLSKDSVYFPNYYQQLGKGNTSDAEFVTQNSLHAAMVAPTYERYTDNTFNGLPWLMKANGYSTSVFHGFKKDFWNRRNAYPSQGFDLFIGEEDLHVDETLGLGITDVDFYKQIIPVLSTEKSPFYSFVISLSSHTPFKMPDAYQALSLRPEDDDTFFGNYLQSMHYADKAIGVLVQSLKDANLYDDTLIVIYGDHFGISTKQKDDISPVENWLGTPYDFNHMMNIPLIFHLPGLGNVDRIETSGGQIDFAPTLLHLMGEETIPKNFLGQDLFTAEKGFVATQTYMLKGSFITDDIVFEMSRDGVFENSRVYNIHTLESLKPEDYRALYEKALREIDLSHSILENDAFKSP